MGDQKIEDAVRVILKEIGEDVNREGVQFTPHRIARLYENLFYGYKKELVVMNEEQRNTLVGTNEIPITVFKNETRGMVIRKVEGISFCEHHLSPFPYTCWVGIIPDKYMMGMNKIDKVVKFFGARLQVQERLTNQITKWINGNVKPKGVIVVMKGEHYCAKLQGDNGTFTTSEVSGYFDENKDQCKDEFMRLCGFKEG